MDERDSERTCLDQTNWLLSHHDVHITLWIIASSTSLTDCSAIMMYTSQCGSSHRLLLYQASWCTHRSVDHRTVHVFCRLLSHHDVHITLWIIASSTSLTDCSAIMMYTSQCGSSHCSRLLQTAVADADSVLFRHHDVSDSGSHHLLHQHASDGGRENQLQHLPPLSIPHHMQPKCFQVSNMLV